MTERPAPGPHHAGLGRGDHRSGVKEPRCIQPGQPQAPDGQALCETTPARFFQVRPLRLNRGRPASGDGSGAGAG